MFVGDDAVGDLRLGSSQISRAYHGVNLVWPPNSAPLGAPSILAWWRADDLSTITLDGSNRVSQWRDVKEGYVLSQSTAGNRPFYSATEWAGSEPGIRFSRTDETYLTMASTPWPMGPQPQHDNQRARTMMLMVVDQLDGAGVSGARTLLAFGNTAVDQLKMQRRVADGVARVAAEVGNGFSTFPETFLDGEFTGRCGIMGLFEDLNTTCALNNSWSGVCSLAVRTAPGRTRVGASAANPPSEFASFRVRDIMIGSTLDIETIEEWDMLVAWILNRRDP